MHSRVLARLRPSRGKDEGQLEFKSSVIGLPGGGTAQSIKDAKNAAYKLAYGVVRRPRPLQSIALIETCAEMCRTEGVNFAEVLTEVLQDPLSEGHGALYSIITNDRIIYPHGLLSAILNHSGPLSSKAIDEVDFACTRLYTSYMMYNQGTLNHLWGHPAYHGLSGTDELSLGGTSPADYIEVENTYVYGPSGQYPTHGGPVVQYRTPGGLVVHFEITQFHKRMSTSGKIVLKFIANGMSPC